MRAEVLFSILQPADVILVRGRNAVSRIIVLFQMMSTGNARVNHVGIYLGHGWIGESLWNGFRSTNFLWYCKENIIVYRNKNLTREQRLQIVDKATSLLGVRYGFFTLLMFAFEAMLITLFGYRTKLIPWKRRRLVCSQAVGYAYECVIPNAFGNKYYRLTPDMIDDHCFKNPQDWEIVYDTLYNNRSH